MLVECKTLGGCKTDKAKITGGYNLPAKYVIHTVGPIYVDGKYSKKALLESCYRESLALALEHNCETVAFPLISSRVYGYPKDQALNVLSTALFLTSRKRRATPPFKLYLQLPTKNSSQRSSAKVQG